MDIKKNFPILNRKSNGKGIVYLDSSATSQKPLAVLETMDEYYKMHNANVHRGVYKLAEEATEIYEGTRKKLAQFIGAGAKNEKQIIYTRGTTEALNLVMRAYGEKFVKKGDKIVTSIMEHHSNFVPWQQLAKNKGAKFEVLDIDDNGEIADSELEKIKGAKLVAIAHASNVLGTINHVEKICKLAKESGAISVVDGAQSVPHMPVDVRKIGCDFLAFSGHKMLGPTGIGVLYGREELLESMDPFLYGGEMISEVTVEKSEWNALPYKFEAGTMPIAETAGLGAAIDYLQKIGMQNVRNHETRLTKYMLKRLSEVHNLEIYGPKKAESRAGLAAFNLRGIHAHDLATVLDEQGVAIRSGHHCAMPLHTRLGIAASARASLSIYNNEQDIDMLINGLQEAKKIFKLGNK